VQAAVATESMENIKYKNEQYIHFIDSVIEQERTILKDVEKLEQANQKLNEKNKLLIRRFVLVITVIFIGGVSFYLKSAFAFVLGSILTVALNVIIAKSGLWTFLSLLLNGINTCRTFFKSKN